MSKRLKKPELFDAIITRDEGMLAIFRYIESIAGTGQPVLITGETGVGKDLIARAIHAASGLSGRFVSVNVAGLDDNMFSDTLFGHARGAFTGAEAERKGLIEQTRGGSLFLDEIGDLGASSQVKLLRLLQEGEYLPLGRDRVRKTDARTISATNCDLWALQRTGRFRQDLNFRIRTHHINVPPLRERRGDLPLLLDHFLDETSRTLGRERPKVEKGLIPLLAGFSFSGNLRELKAMIFDATARSESDSLGPQDFEAYLSRAERELEADRLPPAGSGHIIFPDRLPTIKGTTQQLVLEAMRRANGVKSVAAEMLGISRQALSKRLIKQAELAASTTRRRPPPA